MTKNFTCNIQDSKQIKKIVEEVNPDIVFHLAAQPLVRLSYLDPLETWQTNVNGTLNILEGLKNIKKKVGVVIITTDKVYKNNNWVYGYRESDQLGGHDPYSASKAASEIAVSSWRSSFCGIGSNQTKYLSIATARAGNVVGGGDWAEDRLVPDIVRSLLTSKKIIIRNPNSTRPWQHVLEPLFGYLILAKKLYEIPINQEEYSANHFKLCSPFNFGPNFTSNKKVREVVEECLLYWDGEWILKI